MPRVSILLPCRDAARHLPAAIASVRAQTFPDYEVVAVDDGSDDATPDILAGWAAADPRVRVLTRGRRGLVPALATGLAEARGELVARMDADDIAHPTRLERQLALLDRDRRVAACGTGVEYFPPEAVRDGARRYQAWINSLVEPDQIARDIFIECPIPHPTLVIRRGILVSLGGYRDLGWPEDYDLVLRLWTAGHPMAKVPEVLYRWRERPERASRTDPRYAASRFRRLKTSFLRETLLAGGRPAIIVGAGPTGKRFARALIAAGTRVVAFIDLDPARIGQEIHGAPVLAPGDLERALEPALEPAPPRRDRRRARPLVLAAVGQEGAREEIRAACRRLGLVEGEDFVAVA